MAGPAAGPALPLAGWMERVSLPAAGLELIAKLDTGADSSSIDGRGLERFRRGGRSFVRFLARDDRGAEARIEAAVVRLARVKRQGGSPDRRPVIRLAVRVGPHAVEGEFTVADRSGLECRMLIGRNILAGRLLVDSSRIHVLSEPAIPRNKAAATR